MPRPWAKRADELVEKEGHWADYAAFEEWFDSQNNAGITEVFSIGSFETIEKVSIYLTCCNLADGTARELPVKGGG